MLCDRAFYEVVECDNTLIGDAEAQRWTASGGLVGGALLLCETAAGAGIARTLLGTLLWRAGNARGTSLTS